MHALRNETININKLTDYGKISYKSCKAGTRHACSKTSAPIQPSSSRLALNPKPQQACLVDILGRLTELLLDRGLHGDEILLALEELFFVGDAQWDTLQLGAPKGLCGGDTVGEACQGPWQQCRDTSARPEEFRSPGL